ncbi:MerR family transcriptional regulator [Streptomyces sp. DT171]|uniref:MerR family transcriptional regulator n=1 Tax=Streptomyces sp. DT171 TaxID=3416524 RepID=UPI003CEE8BB9
MATEAGEPTLTFTVDELAARAGVTVRTVRFYGTRGLLPPPAIGPRRVGHYGPGHLSRLELIEELQRQGMTLSAIERYLERLPPDLSAPELAMHRALVASWAPESAQDLTRAELERRAGRKLSGADLGRLTAMGVLEDAQASGAENAQASGAENAQKSGTENAQPSGTGGGEPSGTGDAQKSGTGNAEPPGTGSAEPSGGRFRVDLGLLRLGVELLDVPIAHGTILAARTVLLEHTRSAARELTRLFRDEVWGPYRERESDPEHVAAMKSLSAHMQPMVVQALVTAFQRSLREKLRAAFTEE